MRWSPALIVRLIVPPAALAACKQDPRLGRAFQDKNAMSRVPIDLETSRGMTSAGLEANRNRRISVLNAFESFLAHDTVGEVRQIPRWVR